VAPKTFALKFARSSEKKSRHSATPCRRVISARAFRRNGHIVSGALLNENDIHQRKEASWVSKQFHGKAAQSRRRCEIPLHGHVDQRSL